MSDVNPNTLRSRARRARMTSAERTAYWAKYAQKRRLDLVKLLAPDGCCAKCGGIFSHEQLEVDHAEGIGWDHNSVNQRARYARYWREHRQGVPLRAMCPPCNQSDGQRFRHGYERSGQRRAS